MTNEEKYKTVDERREAFERFCRGAGGCASCAISKALPSYRCLFEWLALEAEEEKPLPCPFCGKETMRIHTHSDNCFAVRCMYCGYISAHTASEHGAIHNHNELCRKMRGEGK